MLVVTGLLLWASVQQGLYAQKRSLPQTISMAVKNEVHPKLSADGNTMVYMTNMFDNRMQLVWTTKENGRWVYPPKLVNAGTVLPGNYALSADGYLLVVSMMATPSIGGYDLYFLERKGDYWSQPKNPGKPVNSSNNELYPSLSTDLSTLYYSSCTSINSGCSFFTTERRNKLYWNDPLEMKIPLEPNFSSATILADQRTAYIRNKAEGGTTLHYSRKEHITWSQPVKMPFAEEFEDIGVTALGNIVYAHARGRNSLDLFEVMVPKAFRPANVVLMEVEFPEVKGKMLLEVFDILSQTPLHRQVVEESGAYSLYIPEANMVDISVFTEESGKSYFSAFIDASIIPEPKKYTFQVDLPEISQNQSYSTTLAFHENSANLIQSSDREVARIIKLLKQNADLSIQFELMQPKVDESETPKMELPLERMDTTLLITLMDTTVRYTKVYHNDFTKLRLAELEEVFLKKGVPPGRISFAAVSPDNPADLNAEDKEKNYKLIFRVL